MGRGNKANGVIPAVRCSSTEALAGKNPMHHTGKLYTLAAAKIADHIHREVDLSNEVVLLARNGQPLRDPAFAGVRLAGEPTLRQRKVIAGIIHDTVSNLGELSTWLLNAPALDRFRQPALTARV